MRARVDTLAGGIQGRLLISVLTFFGPLLRSLERYKWWIRGLTAAQPSVAERPVQALPWSWRERAFSAAFLTATPLEKETIPPRLMEGPPAPTDSAPLRHGVAESDPPGPPPRFAAP